MSMSTATLTTMRARIGNDEHFVHDTLHGDFGEWPRHAAADALTTAESFPEPDEDNPKQVADLIVKTLSCWEWGLEQ